MKNTTASWVAGALAVLVCAACSEPADELSSSAPPGGEPPATGPEDTNPATPPPAPVCPGAGKAYLGIGGVDLRASRVDAPAAIDRGRAKPYSALTGELARVLGATPASSPEIATALGTVPARWYIETEGSAMALYSAHRVAFDGCLTMTATGAAYASAPTAQTATAECTSLATKAWSRRPEKEQLDACVKLAVTDSAAEPDPRRRWAAVCAAIVSSAGFVTY